MSRLDLVIFGATGYTGKHVATELVQVAKTQGLTWGIAGRSQNKLQDLLKEISGKTGENLSAVRVIEADVQNEHSLRLMCSQAKVLVNCCGPYALYGEAVVKAAIDSKAHYVDCSGEPTFIELMQLKYDKAAHDAGVYIISACAFESIPIDMGVLYLEQNFQGVLNSVECYLSPQIPTDLMSKRKRSGVVNYGTWHSLVHCLAHFSELPALRKQIYPEPLPKFVPKLSFRWPFHRRFKGWCLPLLGNDAPTVYRTQRYFYEKDQKRPAQIQTYVKFDSFFSTLSVALSFVLVYIMCQLSLTKKILLKYSNYCTFGMVTDGPSQDVVENTGFQMEMYGIGWEKRLEAYINVIPPNKVMVAKVSGTNIYNMTAIGMIYSALTIIKEQGKMPPGGGVLTTGVAFSKTNLMKSLQDNGLKFEIVDRKVQ